MTDFALATPSEIIQALGERLKKQRLLKNLTQGELAARAGVSKGTINNLETNGQCSLQTFVHALVALDLSSELNHVFLFKIKSISDMEKEALQQRQRASHKRPRSR